MVVVLRLICKIAAIGARQQQCFCVLALKEISFLWGFLLWQKRNNSTAVVFDWHPVGSLELGFHVKEKYTTGARFIVYKRDFVSDGLALFTCQVSQHMAGLRCLGKPLSS